MIGYGGVESVLLCQCENNHTIIGHTPLFDCQDGIGACTAKGNDICFATRIEKGCISRRKCFRYDDFGYEARKTFMKCCNTNYCNIHIDQNTIDDFNEGKPKY